MNFSRAFFMQRVRSPQNYRTKRTPAQETNARALRERGHARSASAAGRALFGDACVHGRNDRRTEREPVGAHAVPFLNQKSVRLQEFADLRTLQPANFLNKGQ